MARLSQSEASALIAWNIERATWFSANIWRGKAMLPFAGASRQLTLGEVDAMMMDWAKRRKAA